MAFWGFTPYFTPGGVFCRPVLLQLLVGANNKYVHLAKHVPEFISKLKRVRRSPRTELTLTVEYGSSLNDACCRHSLNASVFDNS